MKELYEKQEDGSLKPIEGPVASYSVKKIACDFKYLKEQIGENMACELIKLLSQSPDHRW